MKKNTIKAFTLVEMLIVIVIIGILIASLMPRMQTAQGRARDVARKNDLSQIQTAIITSQSDRKVWPGYWTNKQWSEDASKWIKISDIDELLLEAWMSSVPTDPNADNVNFWLWETTNANANGEYIYVIAKRNWVPDGWFALMAKTEVEWSSNWVTCQKADGTPNDTATHDLAHWYISNDDDLADVELCKSVEQGTCSATPDADGKCYYGETAELRYLLVY